MLTPVLAHSGQPPEPHDLWAAWNLDPLLLLALVAAVWLHGRGSLARGRRTGEPWRRHAFVGAVVAIAVAVLSPLDALSSALASAHMVQHLLLVLVAAPLLAWSAPGAALVHALPTAAHRTVARWRSRTGLNRRNLRLLREPTAVWLLHVGVLWFWHGAGPYDAALGNELLHVVEHASFLATGVLFWRVVVGSRAAGRVSNGFGVLLVFTMGMQSVFLSLLLTFAREPWYMGYAGTTAPWGLEPLADQQLAGVIMWIPASLVYLGTALTLLVAWVQASEHDQAPVPLRAGTEPDPITGPVG